MDREELLGLISNAEAMYDEAVASGDTENAEIIKSEIQTMIGALEQTPAPAVAPEEERSFGQTRTGQIVSGINEGFYSNLAGAPVNLGRAGQGINNAAIRGWNWLTGDDVEQFDEFPQGMVGSPEYFREQMRAEDSLYADVMGGPMSSPVQEDRSTARRAGNMTGEGLLALLALGRLKSPTTSPIPGPTGAISTIPQAIANEAAKPYALPRLLAGDAALSTSSAAGGEIAATVGGEEWRPTGEVIGGVGPGAIAGAGRSVVQGGPAAQSTYEAARRIGVDSTPGSLGGRGMAHIEESAKAVPGANAITTNKQQRQGQQLSDAFDTITYENRNTFDEAGNLVGEEVPPVNTPYSAGQRVSDTITEDALPNLQARIGELTEQQYTSVGGPDAPIDVSRVFDELEAYRPSMIPENAAVLDSRLRQLRDSRIPIDQELHETLVRRRDYFKEIGEDTRIVDQQIEDNMTNTVRADVLEDWRKTLGPDIASQRAGLRTDAANAAYRSTRDSQRSTAAGTADENALADFERATAEKARIVGDEQLEKGGELDFLQGLASKEPDAIWRSVSNQNAVGRLEALKRTMPPEKFKVLVSDILTTMAKPTTTAAQKSDVNTDTLDIGGLAKNWQNLDPKMQDLLIPDPANRQRMNDLVEVANGMISRSGSTNISNSQTNAGPLDLVKATAGGAAVGGLAGGASGALIGAGVPLATAGGLTAAQAAFLSDAFTRIVGGQTSSIPGASRAVTRTGAQQALPDEEVVE